MVELTHHLSAMSSLMMVLMLAVGIAAFDLQEANTIYLLEVLGDGNRSFSIDYDRNTFTMDGKPFRYVSGSLHYFRCPRRYWRDRLRTMRAAGINAVSTYVEWSFHEPEKGKYRWEGDQDLVRFIKLAQEEDLYVILRPGPYICAERDLGGFPYWLLSYYPNIILRTSDEDYKREVELWYGKLMPLMQPLLYGNGGPIITVQVENEYGSYPACDKPYMVWLANLTRTWTGDAAVLFTTDGASVKMLNCGSTPGVYATVDFGTGVDMENAWAIMRRYSQKGPLVNSEFYPGWLSHWGEPVVRVATADVIQDLVPMLAEGANVNFYMFHGGTNFDYTAGANIGAKYTPDLTSYDYDAPMTEAGDPTSKYTAIRDVLLNYTEMPTYPPPAVKGKGSLGPITLEPVIALMSAEGRVTFGSGPTNWKEPPTQEALFQRSGLTLYEKQLPDKRLDPAELSVPGLRDRALVYLDGTFVGALIRTREMFSLPVLAAQGNYLQILVENQGRNNFGQVENDFKGIKGNVTLNSVKLHHWKVTSFSLETVDSQLATSIARSKSRSRFQVHEGRTATTRNFLSTGPVFYSARFTLKEGEVLDTYLDVTGWSKGYAWVNDRHLGRYWPSEGPQVTLYTPGVYLNPYPLENTIVLLEFQSAPPNWTVSFVDHAIGV